MLCPPTVVQVFQSTARGILTCRRRSKFTYWRNVENIVDTVHQTATSQLSDNASQHSLES